MSVMSSLQAWYEEQSLAGNLPTSALVTASSKTSAPSPPLPPPPSSSSSYELIVKAVGKGTGMTAMQAERFVGFSALSGTAYVAMRMYMYAYNTLSGDDKSEGDASDNSTPIDPITPRQTRRVAHTILGVFRRTLRKILLDDSEYIVARTPSKIKAEKAKANEELPDQLVTHQGSCHCESIRFTIVAPRVIHAQDGHGKIHFRHVEIKASDFQVYAGFENMNTYYVAHRNGPSGDKGAHAFCERCGVHVLYAPSKTSPNVSINVRCLRDDESRQIKIISKKDGISDGIPASKSFEPQIIPDHLSIVSEVTQPFHFQMNNMTRQPSYEMPMQSQFVRPTKSDVSSIASPTSDEDLSLGIPIKQFYAPTTSGKSSSRRSTFSAGTASLTDQSSGSFRGSGRRSMLPPMSPARSTSRGFGGIDEYSYTGESVSHLGDDSLSLNSGRRSIISLREKDAAMRAEALNAAGNPPLHPTVDRNKMKHFMSKYKKNKKAESSA